MVLGQNKSIAERVDSVLSLMTLEEKVGQMNQYNSGFPTGPISDKGDVQDQVKKGMLGSFLNASGSDQTRQLQQLAMSSRLKIPLLFGQDVVHGYRTVFPIPLGEAASWDLDLIEKSARYAAVEASAMGIHWTFAPMVDIARDPRWGRVMEGAGEDTYLGAKIAGARVKGFQGKGLGHTDALMACAKHFAAYGAAVGGRDYNSVDMSIRQLHDVYLPPFLAAKEAGVATFMNSFNDLNGIPATANSYLQREILKNKWKFSGFVVSDWGSVGEMVNHNFAKDDEDAARLAALAGSDMDMESRAYIRFLTDLVRSGKVSLSVVDDAVKRILYKKFELGLFDLPFRFCDPTKEKQQWNNDEHKKHARTIAQKSIVLLKNESNNLPLSKSISSIALIGPLVKSQKEQLGFWSYDWPDDSTRLSSLWDVVSKKVSKNTSLFYAKGCDLNDQGYALTYTKPTDGFEEAMATARKADIVIMYVGEDRNMAGEARSRSNIHLPGAQEALVEAIATTGKPIVLIIGGGRPLIFNKAAGKTKSILFTWWLGNQGNEAIADVLFGEVNPSGKLPMTFPREVGQIPIYYNHFNTGRPAKDENDVNYVSAYNDLPNSPAYPFGYGLSYTTFTYGEIGVNKKLLMAKDTLVASITLTNDGPYDGEEIIQLYIRDKTASLVQPVKSLKGFKKELFKKGESKTISFPLTVNDLLFHDNNGETMWEEGDFDIMIGPDSQRLKTATVHWKK